jgi:hypothetical protein
VTESLPGGHEWASDLDDRREVPILASFLMFGLRGPRAQGPRSSPIRTEVRSYMKVTRGNENAS